jgi:hypothetical protein
VCGSLWATWLPKRPRSAKVNPLETVNTLNLPFANLLGIIFLEGESDRVVAKMLVREDLCTVGNSVHGGAIMALADTVGLSQRLSTCRRAPRDNNHREQDQLREPGAGRDHIDRHSIPCSSPAVALNAAEEASILCVP